MSWLSTLIDILVKYNSKSNPTPISEDITIKELPEPIKIEDIITPTKIEIIKDDKFEYCEKFVNVAEGGWNKVTGDSGGETIFGIARNYHNYWNGWKKVDEYAKQYGRGTQKFKTAVNNDLELKESAKLFFYNTFWLQSNADKMPKEIGLIVYDMEINSGFKQGQKALQSTLNILGANLVVDGIVGKKTLESLLSYYNSDKLTMISAFIKYRYNYYNNIVKKNPSKLKFWAGWVNRLRNLSKYICGETFSFLVI